MKITPESEIREQVNAKSINQPFREELGTDDNDMPHTYSTNSVHAIYAPFPQSDAVVPYLPVPMQVHNRRLAVKAVFASNQSFLSLTNILGSYLTCKMNNEQHRQRHLFEGPYRIHSQPEVQKYNHFMTKLEVLSGVLLNDKRSVCEDWENALGTYRRQVFADLCNNNGIARCFSKELPDGPLSLPQLSDHALGIAKKLHHEPLNIPILHLSAALDVLSKVRTVILVDDSASMINLPLYGDDISLESCWDQARRIISSVAPKVAQYSRHGIDLHFLNRATICSSLHTEKEVHEAFNAVTPASGTPTGARVNDILDAYMCTLRYYQDLLPLNLLILTDGKANDEEILRWTVEEHLTKIINRGYPAHQLGIEFVQVGNCMNTTRELVKLKLKVNRHFKRNIVGVTPTAQISNINPDLLLDNAACRIYACINGYMRTPRNNW